jgi:hypothetical protein
MTLTLDLPSDLEESLVDRAASLGLSVPAYALSLLISGSQPLPAEKPPRTGAELVEYCEREGWALALTSPTAWSTPTRCARGRRGGIGPDPA